MAALHLAHDAIGDVVGSELAALLGDHELPGEVEQEVAELLADGVGILLAERVVELEHFLDQVGPQRLPGLRAVPGAAHAQVPHEVEHASKRELSCMVLRPGSLRADMAMTSSRHRHARGWTWISRRWWETRAPSRTGHAPACCRWSKLTATDWGPCG